MRMGLMMAICVMAAAGAGCSGSKKNPFLPFEKTEAGMANAVNTVFSGGKPTKKVTPLQIRRQQAAMWKNFTNLISGKAGTANANGVTPAK